MDENAEIQQQNSTTETPTTNLGWESVARGPEVKQKLPNDTKISETHPVPGGLSLVATRENLDTIIDAPCLEACTALYDKNIETYTSSGNGTLLRVGYPAHIGIVYDTLSPRNQQIVNELVAQGLMEPITQGEDPSTIGIGRVTGILVPLSEESTIGSVTAEFMKIVDQLEEQDLKFGFSTRKQALRRLEIYLKGYGDEYVVLNPDNSLNFEATLHNLGEDRDVDTVITEWFELHYDPEEDVFWENRELYEKHRRYLASHPGESQN